MKLGFFSVMQNPGHQLPYRRLLTDLVEETRAVEEAGYHAVWLGEHHFGGEGFDIIPNPITIAANLAAETSRIRLGLAAVIVTQWHPLRIAEDIARVVWSVVWVGASSLGSSQTSTSTPTAGTGRRTGACS